MSSPQSDPAGRGTAETIMLEVLRERDELISELNRQLHAQEAKITQLVDAIESHGASQLLQLNMEDLVRSGFICETEGRHLMVIEVTALLQQNSPYLHLDQRVKIVKEDISSENARRTEELHQSYVQLLQEFGTLQTVLQ